MLLSCDNYSHTVREETSWDVIHLSVNSRDWEEKVDSRGENRYYTCAFSVPDLTEHVCDYGVVLCYLKIEGDAQEILPYTRLRESNGQRWTQVVDFDYSRKNVRFYVTNSDFIVDPPQSMEFRLVLLQ